MKPWINKAKLLLEHSLGGNIPQELNELDWKESLSHNNDKIIRHLSAFANHPGGGYLVFGVDDKAGKPIGVDQNDVSKIIERLSNLARNNVEPVIIIDHTTIFLQDKNLLLIHIKESAVKPVYIAGKTIEESYLRSGCSTRKASRQEIGGLMLIVKLLFLKSYMLLN